MMFKILWYLKSNIYDIIKDVDDEKIFIDDSFTPTWSLRKRQKLMDTIFNQYDMPKFYFLRQKDKTFHILDGKERMSAIFDFINNEYILPKGFVFNSMPNIKIGGKTYEQISEFLHPHHAFITYNLEIKTIAGDYMQVLKRLNL